MSARSSRSTTADGDSHHHGSTVVHSVRVSFRNAGEVGPSRVCKVRGNASVTSQGAFGGEDMENKVLTEQREKLCGGDPRAAVEGMGDSSMSTRKNLD